MVKDNSFLIFTHESRICHSTTDLRLAWSKFIKTWFLRFRLRSASLQLIRRLRLRLQYRPNGISFLGDGSGLEEQVKHRGLLWWLVSVISVSFYRLKQVTWPNTNSRDRGKFLALTGGGIKTKKVWWRRVLKNWAYNEFNYISLQL